MILPIKCLTYRDLKNYAHECARELAKNAMRLHPIDREALGGMIERAYEVELKELEIMEAANV